MSNIKRILICCNPDLNFIDGSSIWAQTIALAVAATGNVEVDFIAKSTPERDELFQPLNGECRLNIIDGTHPQYWQGKRYRRLTSPMMADLANSLDHTNSYDVIILRGLEIATKLLHTPHVLRKCWVYLTDIPQRVEDCSAEQRATLQEIAQSCSLLLCQTEGFQTLWQAIAPQVTREKYRLYTPVIPDLPTSLIPLNQRHLRVIYAGKFKSEWMTLEMAECWPRIHRQVPGSELVMIGDKIHVEPHRPDYQERMRRALENTAGLRWLGAQSRDGVQQQMQKARVGLSWRAEAMNDTLEYSTKVLEYGRAGCAAILNRNELHEKLLGCDYPLYANSLDEFNYQLPRALTEPYIAQRGAEVLRALAERHTFSSRVAEIRQWLGASAKPAEPARTKRVLVAGHDLKFFAPLQKELEATGRFEFATDQWQGHNKHDETKSTALLDKADVIFCEWCLGNLKWYSHNKRPNQKLVARFHAQETRAPYMGEADWNAIDLVSFVSEHTRRQALEKFPGFPIEKTVVIPNYLDSSRFTPKKKTGDARFTLGMVGVAPKSKRLDRAIDLLELLLEVDDRYCLRVKGKHPLDYDWLIKRDDELNYYRELFRRINGNPKLRYKVIFDPPGDDVNDWFTMVGFVLSPSDFESFHMAVGEGLLTGTTPIIWDWVGAREVWGERWVVRSLDEAKARVLEGGYDNAAVQETLVRLRGTVVSSRWKFALENGN